ncbi:MAG: SAM-dependent methyltransferase [Ignavibacteriales bacterium]|nr:SAM-dependent methyltransferase [Ignavibacteriales bacterium]
MKTVVVTDQIEPTLAHPVSQLVTQSQFEEPAYQRWCAEMRESPRFHRKQWEFVYILQVLREHDLLRKGIRGLGFGVGAEPLPAVMAKYGCSVLATEINIEQAHEQGWVKNQTRESQLTLLNNRGICDADTFRKLVSYKDVDMNFIPDTLRDFDFVWSCCSLEHLGSLEHSIAFIVKSLECLKPGGAAIHTTEYNASSNLFTVKKASTVFFRKRDVIGLCNVLVNDGHEVALNLHKGSGKLDHYYDWPPYREDKHLKLLVSKQWTLLVATSLGLVIKKKL